MDVPSFSSIDREPKVIVSPKIMGNADFIEVVTHKKKTTEKKGQIKYIDNYNLIFEDMFPYEFPSDSIYSHIPHVDPLNHSAYLSFQKQIDDELLKVPCRKKSILTNIQHIPMFSDFLGRVEIDQGYLRSCKSFLDAKIEEIGLHPHDFYWFLKHRSDYSAPFPHISFSQKKKLLQYPSKAHKEKLHISRKVTIPVPSYDTSRIPTSLQKQTKTYIQKKGSPLSILLSNGIKSSYLPESSIQISAHSFDNFDSLDYHRSDLQAILNTCIQQPEMARMSHVSVNMGADMVFRSKNSTFTLASHHFADVSNPHYAIRFARDLGKYISGKSISSIINSISNSPSTMAKDIDMFISRIRSEYPVQYVGSQHISSISGCMRIIGKNPKKKKVKKEDSSVSKSKSPRLFESKLDKNQNNNSPSQVAEDNQSDIVSSPSSRVSQDMVPKIDSKQPSAMDSCGENSITSDDESFYSASSPSSSSISNDQQQRIMQQTSSSSCQKKSPATPRVICDVGGELVHRSKLDVRSSIGTKVSIGLGDQRVGEESSLSKGNDLCPKMDIGEFPIHFHSLSSFDSPHCAAFPSSLAVSGSVSSDLSLHFSSLFHHNHSKSSQDTKDPVEIHDSELEDTHIQDPTSVLSNPHSLYIGKKKKGIDLQSIFGMAGVYTEEGLGIGIGTCFRAKNRYQIGMGCVVGGGIGAHASMCVGSTSNSEGKVPQSSLQVSLATFYPFAPIESLDPDMESFADLSDSSIPSFSSGPSTVQQDFATFLGVPTHVKVPCMGVNINLNVNLATQGPKTSRFKNFWKKLFGTK
ncbi:hypothetical protein ADUPG1_012625 [Aduncisulcus paluster]|uniref:Uncharacterized protein n=1 Tax=Aduncisulcus paluster TaxID=2918883 RepID=A0ABQ5K1Y9_9EUKA|nr:hypothetical protein ADUPG1_012625 [Aduncisulcus paluster]